MNGSFFLVIVFLFILSILNSYPDLLSMDIHTRLEPDLKKKIQTILTQKLINNFN